MVQVTSNLRVLFWTRRRTAPRGGDQIALEYTIAALRARGVECDVSNILSQDLTPYSLVHLYNLSDPNSAVAYVDRLIDAQKPFVVTPIYWPHQQWLDARTHATPATNPEFFLGELADEERALSADVLRAQENMARAAHQLVFDATARIFALSNMERDLISCEFHAAAERLHVTYNGIDPAFQHGDAERFFKAYGLRDFVFSAARIEERKNTISVIRAWREETIPLVLAGNAPEADYLALCQHEANANVHFLGALAPASLADAYAAARVHVLASWWEEASLSALEAALAGCAIVMTKNSSAHEYFGDACILCDPADPPSIHDALRAAYNAPGQTELAAQVREKFTWDRAVETLCAAYHEIAAQPQNFLPYGDASAWKQVSSSLSELLYLRETYLNTLETQARKQAAWAHELEKMVIAHDSVRARWQPLARLARKFSPRP